MEYALGIDTSNYKTSVALVDSNDKIVYDGRVLLTVPEGGIGLRQQEALFQHILNLPVLIKEAFGIVGNGEIISVSASSRPRPLENSYMPCFVAGENQCRIISTILGCEMNLFSHQEGHLSAARRFTPLRYEEKFMFFHFSGGTTEILNYDRGKINLLGTSDDISFGQLLDRIGNKLGYTFPAGEKIDELAYNHLLTGTNIENELPKIKTHDASFNLSGIETAATKLIEVIEKEKLAYMLMERITDCIKEIIISINTRSHSMRKFLFSGGVSSSRFMREKLKNFEDVELYFSTPELASDNAIGIAFLGGDKFWQQNQ